MGGRDRPVAVTRVVWLVWALVLLAALMTVLSAILDEEILRAYDAFTVSADSARSAPSFTPVIVVLDVVVTALVLVLLAFLLGGHTWARHCLAATFGLLAISTVAMLRTGTPLPFTVLLVVSLLADVLLLVLLYRPGMRTAVAPRGAGTVGHAAA